MKSVGVSYYSYLSNMEQKLKEERDQRKKLEMEIINLKRQNE
jgi:hypothetical protein